VSFCYPGATGTGDSTGVQGQQEAFPVAHASDGGARAIRFSFQDVPLLTALGLYHTEP
jgi:hypothetical protein